MEDWERGFQIGGNRVANFQYLGMLPSADTVGTYSWQHLMRTYRPTYCIINWNQKAKNHSNV